MPGLAPNARSRLIAESPTLAIAARAAELRAAGKDVISLGAGEPDFPTPAPVAQAGIAAIAEGRYRYTAAAGLPALRAAGAAWFGSAFGLDYRADEVLVTAGAKPALHVALSAVLEPGDGVLILAPYWVSYPALVRMAGGEPLLLPPAPENGFVHDPDAIAAIARRQRIRGIIVNYPNNPSGAVPTRAQMQALVEVAAAHDLWLLSDEIYALLRYDDAEHCSPASLTGGRERTLVVNAFTKSHTLTGWRVGFLAGPRPVIAAAARIQSQLLGNACTISQHAALAACAEPPLAEATARLRALDARRRFLCAELTAVPGFSLTPPRGAFYVFVDARGLCRRLQLTDEQVCERLLDEQLLAIVPGCAFGAPGFVRISYAASMDDLQRAIPRLLAFATAGRS